MMLWNVGNTLPAKRKNMSRSKYERQREAESETEKSPKQSLCAQQMNKNMVAFYEQGEKNGKTSNKRRGDTYGSNRKNISCGNEHGKAYAKMRGKK